MDSRTRKRRRNKIDLGNKKFQHIPLKSMAPLLERETVFEFAWPGTLINKHCQIYQRLLYISKAQIHQR